MRHRANAERCSAPGRPRDGTAPLPQRTGDLAFIFLTYDFDGQSVHERLYQTRTGVTKEEKKMSATVVAPSTLDVEEVAARNKGAEVAKVPKHGLLMVSYAPGKKDQKQDTQTTGTSHDTL